MGFNQPKKAKGIPYITQQSTSATDLYPTSAGIDHPYDTWLDFTNSKILFVYDNSASGSDNVRTARSIITWIQADYPTNPEYGDIWITPVGTARIYRLPPIGWDELVSAAAPPVVSTPPTATDNYYTKVQGVVITGNVITDDTGAGVDQDAVSITVQSYTQPASGVLFINPNGAFTFTPELSAVGTVDCTYTIINPATLTDTATVTFELTAATAPIPNQPPVATQNEYSGYANTPITGNFITDDTGGGTDFDPDSTFTIQAYSNPSYGSLAVTATGAASGFFLYTPSSDYTGSDSFVYGIVDPTALAASATVSLTVDVPLIARNNSYDVTMNTPFNTGNFITDNTGSGVDSSPAGETFHIYEWTSPSNGVLSVVTGGALSGSFTYIPDTGIYDVVDSFIYKIRSDTTSYESSATVSLTLNFPLNFAFEQELGDSSVIKPTLSNFDALWKQNYTDGTPAFGGYMACGDDSPITGYLHIYDDNFDEIDEVDIGFTFPSVPARGIEWNSDGTRLAVTTQAASQTLFLFDTSDNDPSNWYEATSYDTQPTGNSWCVGWEKSGPRIAQGTETSPYIYIWTPDPWHTNIEKEWITPHPNFQAPNGRVEALDWTPVGAPYELLAVGTSQNPEMMVYAVSGNYNDLDYLSGTGLVHPDHVHAVKFSPDGKKLAYAGNDSTLYVYAVSGAQTWQQLQAISVGISHINSMAWNHDGSVLVVGGELGDYLKAYNTSTWVALANPATLPDDEVNGMDFNYNGEIFVCTTQGVRELMRYNTTTSPWTYIEDISGVNSINYDTVDVSFGPESGSTPSVPDGNLVIPSAGSGNQSWFAQEPYWDSHGTSAMTIT